MPATAMTTRPPRRQWGAETHSDPLAITHERPSARKILLGRAAILVTIFAWAMYVITTILREFVEGDTQDLRFVLEAISYLLVVTMLSFSALMYLIARQGALYRFRDHVRVPRHELDEHFAGDYDGSITVLVPSYREETDVVAKTLWSAALQEFPAIRVVLLIDDPPHPLDAENRALLDGARQLPQLIEAELRVPAERLAEEHAELFQVASQDEAQPGPDEVARVAAAYDYAASWLEDKAEAHPVKDHLDTFFVDRVLMGLASDLRLTRLALDAALAQGETPPRERLRQLHQRLVWIFSAELVSFERKTFASLSQEANKAMNLNSYIGLMGRRWREERTDSETLLLPAETDDEDGRLVPDSPYLLTLDADSMLLRDYCLRLVYLLEEPGNERIAVTQTPYSSYRGAPTRIERLAGATTDVQHILHQGMTYYDATFWVGANAVIRKRALEDICEVQTVGGHEIYTYIQDRTVIEDTESSIDLGTHGWKLTNYPERLSYSATPPDFGSLVVQRRRWANGGLLILAKFSRQLKERRFRRERVLLREVLLRVNYLASIAWASVGLIFLLAYPYDSRLLSLWVVAAALPYFLCMSGDLKESGHRRIDVFRIYGFNLILLAVNVAGVAKSLQQAFTNDKIPFARTPKVRDRTAAPGLFVLVPLLIIAFSVLTFWRDFNAQNWGNAAFAATNAVLCTWAFLAHIGIKNAVVDMVLGVVGWLYVPVPDRTLKRPPRKGAPVTRRSTPETTDWRSILYYGDRRLGRDVHRKGDLRRRASPR